MSDISDILADEAEIVRIVSRLPEFSWLEAASLGKIRHALNHEVKDALRKYFQENTMNAKPDWIQKFKASGITEDEGKTAISCARRLGIEL